MKYRLMRSAVIITAYRRYTFVEQALDSVLAQTKLPDQIVIVVDNLSNIKNIVKDIPRLTMLEVNHPSLGLKIAKAISELHDDIDIVFLLEDDDIFDKNKIEYIERIFQNTNAVMVHNFQKYIDIKGNDRVSKVYEENQPQEQLVINKNNVFNVFKEFPLIHHNLSSFSIRKKILDKYKNSIANLDILLDVSLFLLSVQEGNIIHIPERLTYFRIGSGITSYGGAPNYNEFLLNQRKITCYRNRMLEDSRKLYKILYQCDQCKKILEIKITKREASLYLLNNYFNCDNKSNMPSGPLLLFKLTKLFITNQIYISEFVIQIGKISLSLFLGKKKSAELFIKIKYKYMQHTNNSIKS